MSRNPDISAIEQISRRPWLDGRRDLFMLVILVVSVALLLWNGSAFVRQVSLVGGEIGREARIAGTALCLNIALILFGWRQYVDLQHEGELRADG